MARPLRIEYSGAVYHITSRGNQRSKIFEDDRDREAYLEILSEVIKRYSWLCYAYCLMDNHYHLFIETPGGDLSRGMRQLNGLYTQRYNTIHRSTGHVFQGRFKSILVEKESYFLELCRYIVLNPVRAGMVKTPKKWQWSSYQATAGISKAPEYMCVDEVLSRFSSGKRKAMRLYREFVADGIGKETIWKSLTGGIILGEEGYIAKIRGMMDEKRETGEIPRVERYAFRPGLEEVFADVSDKKDRNEAFASANIQYGYTFKEIGDFLGIHYSTVSKAVKKGTGR